MKPVELKRTQKYRDNGQVYYEEYFLNSKLHNDNGPAYREYYDNGQVKFENII